MNSFQGKNHLKVDGVQGTSPTDAMVQRTSMQHGITKGLIIAFLFSIRMMAESPTKCDLVGPSIAKNGEKMARVGQPHQLNPHLWQHHCPEQTPGAATASVEPPSLCERPTG